MFLVGNVWEPHTPKCPVSGVQWVYKMPSIKLTERTLKALKVQPGDIRTRYWDSDTPGLFVLVGHKASVFYCKAGGRSFRIGSASDWTVFEAQTRCKEIR